MTEPVTITPFIAEALDPYPEHSTRDHGVRPHTATKTPQVWMVTEGSNVAGPLPSVASSYPRRQVRRGVRRLPWISVGLYALGQLILALTIAAGHIDPILGIVVCLLWMTCGLLLIAAEFTSNRPMTGHHGADLAAMNGPAFEPGRRRTTNDHAGDRL